MLLSHDDGKVEEIMSYNELCDIVAKQHDKEASGEEEVFTFREILDHKKVTRGDPDYQGSTYNVKVLWEDCSETWIPLEAMYKSDPVTLAAYAKENDLLDTTGWKRLKKIARKAKTLQRMVNGNKRAQRYNTIVYKFGV